MSERKRPTDLETGQFSPETATKKSPLQIYQDAINQSLESELAKIITIPETERRLEEIGDYGYIMKIRPTSDIPESSPTNPEYENYNRSRAIEYFFDFDDTVFDYTGYEEATKGKLDQIGIPLDVINALYEEAKVADPKTGNKMLQRELYIKNLKDRFPNLSNEIVAIYRDTQPRDFLNQDIAKLLQLLTAHPNARVHILTYGEINFQRQKVEAVLAELGKPTDILYTQVPKAEFLERYLKTRYPYIESTPDNTQSFVMIDDNPEELRKLVEFSKKQPFFIPIRLRKPNAKRHNIEQTGEKAYEVSRNHARVLLQADEIIRKARGDRYKKISAKQWQQDGFVSIIQTDIHNSATSQDSTFFDVKQTDEGTLVVTRKEMDKADNDKFIEAQSEFQFDPSSRIMYKLRRDESGVVKDRIKYRPQFLDHSAESTFDQPNI